MNNQIHWICFMEMKTLFSRFYSLLSFSCSYCCPFIRQTNTSYSCFLHFNQLNMEIPILLAWKYPTHSLHLPPSLLLSLFHYLLRPLFSWMDQTTSQNDFLTCIQFKYSFNLLQKWNFQCRKMVQTKFQTAQENEIAS